MQVSEYLKNAEYFSLGHLPTEGFHPLTRNLSHLVQNDLPAAIRLIQSIDSTAIGKIKDEIPTLAKLHGDIQTTLQSGGRIFLSGCGATGRLALALESTWRAQHAGTPLEHSIHALMAGGDFALVKSVENFEDFPLYGERHLNGLGYREGDLLIAITEGGETPYVIGTVHGALKSGGKNASPWFVYCNPRDLLCSTVARSKEVIEHPRVNSLCLTVGEMALSGSTRLQAATVQMFAVGLALNTNIQNSAFQKFALNSIDTFTREYAQLDLAQFLAPFVKWESQCYEKKGVVLYKTDSYPIAVLTDTTERSPTFSLVPFEKSKGEPFSLCYLSIPGAHTAAESWKAILNRPPKGLEWSELNGRLGIASILEFNFGIEATRAREDRVKPAQQHTVHLDAHAALKQIEIRTEKNANSGASAPLDLKLVTPLVNRSTFEAALHEQILIKLILNIHSLMVMGLLNRYEGNVMTWVRPSNGKLIDRTVRYLEFLIEKRGLKPRSRDELVNIVFEEQPKLKPDEAIVLKILTQTA